MVTAVHSVLLKVVMDSTLNADSGRMGLKQKKYFDESELMSAKIQHRRDALGFERVALVFHAGGATTRGARIAAVRHGLHCSIPSNFLFDFCALMHNSTSVRLFMNRHFSYG
jgi:hypothetical protein